MYGFDLPNHGNSKGKPRFYIDNYVDLIKLYEEFIHEVILKTQKSRPLFAIGTRNSSLPLIRLCIEKPEVFNAISLISPTFSYIE